MCEPSRAREAALDEEEMYRIRNILMAMETETLLYLALCVPADELVEHIRPPLAPQSAK